ncbi:DUF3299 domain-containing protein [Photobacterium rosenbergii]|uniref:DUF3299 domain-containing protein n=1 Tax=Photobacterium rosenbergii TaxID=294936 RepID=A0ABU3ZGL8_9GAMM|nr:DUF3299 domain-containing protein [Photobacterium rosenbergii]MDV5169259.1 DUF3299 domain-containing protein [Photobacterium rosenbergii]
MSKSTEFDRTAVELQWHDLVPESERERAVQAHAQMLDHNSGQADQLLIGNTRPELNGNNVKIPGFVIPLEGDADTITEFLLVPFYGACIHVPPPPPNQIIHVKFEQGAPTKELWDIVYITGTLKTESLVTESIGVESGYTISGAVLESYDKA